MKRAFEVKSKIFFLVSKVLFFRLTNKTSKNVAYTIFKMHLCHQYLRAQMAKQIQSNFYCALFYEDFWCRLFLVIALGLKHFLFMLYHLGQRTLTIIFKEYFLIIFSHIF